MFLSPAGCSVTASTTPAVAPVTAAALASTNSRGNLPLPTVPTNASVSQAQVWPPSCQLFPRAQADHTLTLPCNEALGDVQLIGTAAAQLTRRLILFSRGSPSDPSRAMILITFRFLLRVQGFTQASPIAQFCLQDELRLGLFTYRTSLFVRRNLW